MKKLNKQKLLGIITIVLMIAIEIIMLIIQKNKISVGKYEILNINFNNIIVGEIALFIIVLLLTVRTMFLKKNIKTNYYICSALLIIELLLISFMFFSNGNFINTCLLFVYSWLIKGDIKTK